MKTLMEIKSVEQLIDREIERMQNDPLSDQIENGAERMQRLRQRKRLVHEMIDQWSLYEWLFGDGDGRSVAMF